MEINKLILDIQQEIDELSEQFKTLAEKQEMQFTEIMQVLRSIEDKYAQTGSNLDEDMDEDEIYEKAKELVIETQKVSTSFLQRRLGLGYARAARMMDRLEDEKVIGAGNGAEPREILIQE